jgi:hypothetical protein
MRPKLLDAAGVVSGRKVTTGELLGQIGNFSQHENGTSYHLHFDIQVPTRAGWVFVSPYMTLVAAYERAIGGRGAEIPDVQIPDLPVARAPVGTIDGTTVAPLTLATIQQAILGPAERVGPVAPVVDMRPRMRFTGGCGAYIGHRRVWRGCSVAPAARAAAAAKAAAVAPAFHGTQIMRHGTTPRAAVLAPRGWRRHRT